MWDEDDGEAARKVFGREDQTTAITSSFNHSATFELFSTLNLCNFNRFFFFFKHVDAF